MSFNFNEFNIFMINFNEFFNPLKEYFLMSFLIHWKNIFMINFFFHCAMSILRGWLLLWNEQVK